MIVSEGESVKKALQDLVCHVQFVPEHEQIIRQSLDALKRTLMNSILITEISMQSSPSLPKPQIPVKKPEKKDVEGNDKLYEAKEFSLQLNNKYDRLFRLADLNKIASAIGPKHGMYPNRNEKRDKTELLLWFRDRFHILENDFTEYMNTMQG